MRILPGISALGILAAILAASAPPQEAPRPPQGDVPITVTISVSSKPGAAVVEIHQDEVTLKQDGKVRPIISMLPPDDPGAQLNLVMLLDPYMSSRMKEYWGQFQGFIRSLPQGSRVAIAEAEKGGPVMDQNFTADLDLAAKSLKFPDLIAAPTSAFYRSVAIMCHDWPNTQGRRVLLTVGPGLNDLEDFHPAVEQAQRTGIVIYALYAPESGIRLGPHENDEGWPDLRVMANATGGKSFDTVTPSFQTGADLRMVAPTDYRPFLQELSSLLKQSYLITFLAKPGTKEEYARFEATVSAKGVTVKAPSHVFVPAIH